MTEEVREGGCLCGAVRYRLTGEPRPVFGCHCTQCRKTSGHFVAATAVKREQLEIVEGADKVTWYGSSPGVRRGFCGTCGSNLFWDRESLDIIAVMAGGLDAPSGLKMTQHIFVSDKGDYYEIADGLPQKPVR